MNRFENLFAVDVIGMSLKFFVNSKVYPFVVKTLENQFQPLISSRYVKEFLGKHPKVIKVKAIAKKDHQQDKSNGYLRKFPEGEI